MYRDSEVASLFHTIKCKYENRAVGFHYSFVGHDVYSLEFKLVSEKNHEKSPITVTVDTNSTFSLEIALETDIVKLSSKYEVDLDPSKVLDSIDNMIDKFTNGDITKLKQEVESVIPQSISYELPDKHYDYLDGDVIYTYSLDLDLGDVEFDVFDLMICKPNNIDGYEYKVRVITEELNLELHAESRYELVTKLLHEYYYSEEKNSLPVQTLLDLVDSITT